MLFRECTSFGRFSITQKLRIVWCMRVMVLLLTGAVIVGAESEKAQKRRCKWPVGFRVVPRVWEVIFHRWKLQFGRMETNKAGDPAELERENSGLKKIPAAALLKWRRNDKKWRFPFFSISGDPRLFITQNSINERTEIFYAMECDQIAVVRRLRAGVATARQHHQVIAVDGHTRVVA